jgi:hypothetical protein
MHTESQGQFDISSATRTSDQGESAGIGEYIAIRLFDAFRGSSRVDLQACKLGTGRRFTTS